MTQGFATKASSFFYLLTVFLIPVQLGKHFWPSFSILLGLRIDYLSPTLYVTDILIFLLFVSFLAHLLFRRKKSKPSNVILNLSFDSAQDPEFIEGQVRNDRGKALRFSLDFEFYILLFALLLVGVLLSKSPMAGLYGLVKLLEFGFFAIFTAWFLKKNPKAYATALLLFAVGIIGESVLAMLQFLNQGSLGGFLYWFGERNFTSQTPGIATASVNGLLLLRPYGTFPHPNALAGYLVISMTLIISNFKFQISNFRKTLYGSALALGTVALLLTMSRVSILVFLVCVIVVLYKKLQKKHRAFGIISCLVAITIIFLLLPHRGFSLGEESVLLRLSLFSTALQILADTWLFGTGLFNFLLYLAEYTKDKQYLLYLQPVHNIFLLWFVETGIVGFGFLLWFLSAIYRQVLRERNITKILLFVNLIVLGMIDHYFLTLQQGQLLLAFSLGFFWSRFSGKK